MNKTKNTRIRRYYTDDEKVKAVTALITTNESHPFSADAVDAARAALGSSIDASVLSRWMDIYGAQVRASLPARPTVAEVVTQARNDTLALWSNLEHKALNRLNDDKVIQTAQYRDLVIAGGTARDKVDRMQGLSPELRQAIIELSQACTLANLDTVLTLKDIAQHIRERAAQISAPLSPKLTDGQDDNR